jgi:hypothetical protein
MESNSEQLPNQTLYVNNLNEKIKTDGKVYSKTRVKTESFSIIFPIRGDFRNTCKEIIQNERPSFHNLQL